MVIEFVTSRCYKSHELAQGSLLWGTVAQVSNVAHGPLVIFYYNYLQKCEEINVEKEKNNDQEKAIKKQSQEISTMSNRISGLERQLNEMVVYIYVYIVT